jgi:hypothetical protein
MSGNAADIVDADPQISQPVSRYLAGSGYIQSITARPWQLSVTESVALPPQPSRRFMANKATIRNAYGMPAMFAGSKTGSDDAAFVFVRVGDEERRMRWVEWDALPAWTGPRPSWGSKSGAPASTPDKT